MRDIPIYSQSIIEMDFLDKSISILLGLLCIRSKVEVEITHLALICSVSVEDDLDISLFGNALGNEVLTDRGTDSGDIEGLSDLDDIIDGVQSLLGLVDELSVI
jgi:hypothetical protein